MSLSDDLVDSDGAIGLTEFRPRTIQLQSHMSAETLWQTFGHELTHVALWDAGVKLTHEQEESVCDALGTYIAAAVLAGRITFK